MLQSGDSLNTFARGQRSLQRDQEDQKLDKLVTVIKGFLRQDQQPNRRSKRIFCNGFCGCGNCYKKRGFPKIESDRIEEPIVAETVENTKPKRLFCNSWGCGNVGKRTMYSKLIETLRAKEPGTSGDEMVPYINGGADDVMVSLDPYQVITLSCMTYKKSHLYIMMTYAAKYSSNGVGCFSSSNLTSSSNVTRCSKTAVGR